MSAIFKPYPSTWGRDEWLRWRRQGAGGSDVAAICGLSTFASPMAVYFDKLGQLDDEPENESMIWGRRLEAPIIEAFQDETGLAVIAPQCLAVDPDHPHRRATLDGLVIENHLEWPAGEIPPHEHLLGVLEVKTTSDYSWEDGIPDRVALQVQWQLLVGQLEHAWLAVLHQGRRFRIYEIEGDVPVQVQLSVIIGRFWERHVLAQVPPPADSNPATTAALKHAFPEAADGSVVQLDDDVLAIAQEWLPAKALAKEAGAYVDLIENRLRAALGDAEEGHDELGPIVTWKTQTKPRRVDEKRLRAERPEIYEEYAAPAGTMRVLRPAKALKAVSA